jgi:ADP-L-glycero-D-manno-heptose 6-epimerase
MLVVTGGAGFIGSNLVKRLNERGREDLLVVDDLTDGRKLENLADCDVFDLVDREAFLDWVQNERSLGEPIEAIFHLGADSNTMQWDGRAILRTNYEYSKSLLAYCTSRQIPLIYASSAAVYGLGPVFKEERRHEHPRNPYAYSKFLFDQLVRRLTPRFSSQVVGLRYFNVYGPREAHKGEMASVAYKQHLNLKRGGAVQLFGASDGYGDGEHRRDFIHVDDCVSVTLWFFDHPEVSGIFNVGTGRAQSFNDVARAVLSHHGRGHIEYVPMPERLRGAYQSFTQADLSALRKAGYEAAFLTVEEGVARYLRWLDERDGG